MQCPHCTIHFHDNWYYNSFIHYNSNLSDHRYGTAYCPGCKKYTIKIETPSRPWRNVYPISGNRGPIPEEVPVDISRDYGEACIVLPFSPNASAALARRCLQKILRTHGYKNSNLSKEIDLLLNETDPKRAIPNSLRETIDGIRNFGNFSAHPITDQTTLQIIDVEPHEAEWCLEIIEEMFQHFYVKPALAAIKKKALNMKLQAAGKPEAK